MVTLLMEQTNTLRFFYNGIKGSDGKLQTCAYHAAQLIHYPAGTITIYARKPRHFSAEIGAALTIQNDSDSQTDYFDVKFYTDLSIGTYDKPLKESI